MEAAESKVKAKGLKRDFFGRLVPEERPSSAAGRPSSAGGKEENGRQSKKQKTDCQTRDEQRVWVSFHEGYSNAVRKPITIEELMRGL